MVDKVPISENYPQFSFTEANGKTVVPYSTSVTKGDVCRSTAKPSWQTKCYNEGRLMAKISSVLRSAPQFYCSRLVLNITYLEVMGNSF